MATYTVQDTTMTALGDAVRSKADKYTTSTDIPIEECVLKIDVDTRELIAEEYAATQYYSVGIDLKTALGDRFDSTTKLYIECNYEAVDCPHALCPFTVELININQIDNGYLEAMGPVIIQGSTLPLIGEHKTYIDYEYKDKLYSYISLHAINSSIDSDSYFKGEFKIWACNSNNDFIVLKKYTPMEMVEIINNLMPVPEEAFLITGDCQHRFAKNSWNWFVENYGNQVETSNITRADYMFANSNSLEHIPFTINFNQLTNIAGMFQGCRDLIELPNIVGSNLTPPTGAYSGLIDFSNMFSSCNSLKSIPNDIFYKIIPNSDYWEKAQTFGINGNSTFNYCTSLRKLPDLSMFSSKWTNGYNSIYVMYSLYVLDEIIDLPVNGTFTSNAFNNFGGSMYHLKNMIFATNEDGTPLVANWKNQTIDLSRDLGRFARDYNATNNGLSNDTYVYNAETYQALKDNPDWWTILWDYCRYNHDSAVNTINSLPDCSSSGGTNTIIFKGAAGALTDGGAINTLTEEEIAVATAKSWTVSLV